MAYRPLVVMYRAFNLKVKETRINRVKDFIIGNESDVSTTITIMYILNEAWTFSDC